ncbi:MAG: site-2 protease family protein [Desulfitobacteriaceae bacterium]|nr:site-2 protease family protein [Desulfitobacteriaceae bacterium]MDD4346542.1 site-2 protease family protein [Desulfitobacteriaceae bacterium]MDD4401824.1 site-2 protease family protein [Desulfitobacteriaceae bacterium]
MKSSFSIGRIKGIQLEINLSWFIVFALVIFSLATGYFPQNYPDWDPVLKWILSGIIALLLFISVLLHELSHSLVSISLGIDVRKISLFIFGGIAQMEKEPDEPVKELKIAVAGPATSILLYILFILLANISAALGSSEVIIVLLTYVASVNLVLAIFNLVPAFPLDGGRVLRAIIWYLSGNLQNATRIASSMGSIFGYFLIFIGIFGVLSGIFISGIWFIFIGWFIIQASQSSYQNMVMTDIFNKIHVSEFMTDKVMTVNYYISVRELVDSYFYKYRFASFPVTRDGEVIGVVNRESIKELNKESWDQTTVGSVTDSLNDNLVVAPYESVSEAMKKLFSNEIGRVLVMDRGNLTGIVSRTDILNYIRIHSQFNQ